MSTSAPVESVPLLDLKAQYAPMRDEIEAAMREVCDSQYFVLGPKVTALEEEVAEYCGAAHGVGVSSGTDALLLALMTLDIGPGDEVITTPYSFFATVGVIWRLGARPVFCDIEPDTWNIDPKAVAVFLAGCERRGDDLINPATGGRVKALMPVHLYGQLADMPALMALAKAYDLRVVEDAAQAIGASGADGARAGSIGDIGCFSFFPSKNLGAFGDGGMCTTQDDALAERMRILRVHGGQPKYYHSLVGGNFRLDALQAAVLSIKLRYLDGWTEGRQTNAARYSEKLADPPTPVQTPVARPGYRHIYNQYIVRCAHRDALREYLLSRKIGCEIYYPVSLHEQACFAELGLKRGAFPHSELAADETLALPIYGELTQPQQDYVIDAIRSFGAGRDDAAAGHSAG